VTVTAAAILRRQRAVAATGRRQAAPAPGCTWTGWRLWRVDGTRLVSPWAPLDPQGRPAVWHDGTLAARCLLTGARHSRPPVANCECGIRAMPLPDLAGTMPLSTGLRWQSLTDQLGAIGRVELSGRIVTASAEDPRAALRGSHARVVELWLVSRLARLADRVAVELGVPVHTGLPDPT
jgi:hypothetical protein